MGKRDNYFNLVMPMLQDGNWGELEGYLVANSNLPGPRANLELAWAFADCFEGSDISEKMFVLLQSWVEHCSAPCGDPQEFLPFCAVQALGSAYLRVSPEKQRIIVDMFKQAAGDSRWRVREAVAMGFQRLAEQDFTAAQAVFTRWLNKSSLVEKRAILAALAHTPLLHSADRVNFCLNVADRVLGEVKGLPREARKTEEFRILRKGLEYTISLFVESLPEQGFDYLKKWAEQEDSDIRRIVKSNLTKARLAKKFSGQVHDVLARL